MRHEANNRYLNLKRSPLLLITLAILSFLLFIPNVANSQTQDSGIVISITNQGFDPENVTVIAGESVHWTNESNDPHTVTASSGLFDSGEIVTGGGFTMALTVPGIHSYTSTGDPSFTGQIQVALSGLRGPSQEPANGHIPDITFPVAQQDDMGEHPELGLIASRTRILLGFVDGASVADANAAIQSANVKIIGGLPDVDILLVAAADTNDFSGLIDALDTLLANPSIDFASISPEMELHELPRPADAITGGPPQNWTWELTEGPTGEPKGDTNNWPLEASRFPQAWNLRETIQRAGNVESTRIGVVDNGFEAHEDIVLTRSVEVLCKNTPDGQKCTQNIPGDHGQLVTGIIGAEYDNDSIETGKSLGLSGVNPVARIGAVNWAYEGGTSAYDEMQEIMNLVLNQVTDVRVLSLSVGPGVPHAAPGDSAWWDTHGVFPICGPGNNDDGDHGSNDFCTPNNDDDWLKFVENAGKVARNIAEYASQKGVIIVDSAGNNSGQTVNSFCIGAGVNVPGCVWEKIETQNIQDFAWASQNWDNPALDNPIIMAEALDRDFKRSAYSNINGDLSAPADEFIRLNLGNSYAYISRGGTSSAAPHIAGFVGYLLAYDPNLTISEIKQHLLTWAQFDTSDDAEPRIDAFGTLLSIDGVAKKLVDVNDRSKDGNRRVILGPSEPGNSGGVELGLDLQSSSDTDSFTNTFYRTDPDGIINMRDFRRFRDALLYNCQYLLSDDSTKAQGQAECPGATEPSDILLNGPADHPKKDLNFDRCVKQHKDDADCPHDESLYPRFDFNGDGRLSRTEFAQVPLKDDGTVAANTAEENLMRDIDLIKALWDSNPDNTEGYGKDDLEDLLFSVDLEIHTSDLFDVGAVGDVTVNIKRLDTNTDLPTRVIPPGDHIIYTVPAGVDIDVRASMEIGGEPKNSIPLKGNIKKPGTDLRVDLCVRDLSLTANPRKLQANGVDESNLIARLNRCTLDPQGPINITFTQTPVGGNHGAVKFGAVSTDPDGKVNNIFTAGTEIAEYEITATAHISDTVKAEGKTTIETVDPLKVVYKWQQTVHEFHEEGTSRWPVFDLGNPNAGDPFNLECFDATIQGIVYDPVADQPIEGITIELLGPNGLSVVTDADGLYGFSFDLSVDTSPYTATLKASGPSLPASVEKDVTVWCSAIVVANFGWENPSTGRISGRVSDVRTGSSVEGVLMGGEWGATTVTNSQGLYEFEDVPLGLDNKDRIWQITAQPANYPSRFDFATAKASQGTILDLEVGGGDCDDVVIERYVYSISDLIFFDTELVEFTWDIPYFRIWEEGVLKTTLGFRVTEDDFGPVIGPDTVQRIRSEGVPLIDIGWDNCIESFSFRTDGNLSLGREGIIDQSDTGVILSELITSSEISGQFDGRTTNSLRPIEQIWKVSGDAFYNVPDDATDTYQAYELSSNVALDISPDGVTLHGLNEIAELEYPYESLWEFLETMLVNDFLPNQQQTTIGFGDVPGAIGAIMAGVQQKELMLVPRRDGSALKYSNDVSQPITFPQDADGNYLPYSFCQVVDRQYTTNREYYTGFDTTFDTYWTRNTTFDSFSIYDAISSSHQHEYPMPVGPGNWQIEYGFIAVPTNNENDLDGLTVPDCDENDELVSSFTYSPSNPEEGNAVHFTDASLSPGNSIISWDWDFGDTGTSTEQNPAHFYKDNGEYDVTLTVVDAAGNIGVAIDTLEVFNAPPEGQIGGAYAFEGESVEFNVLLSDPGEFDQESLAITIASSEPGFPTIQDSRAAGIHPFQISGLAAGDYPVTLTVTDKDGGSDTDEALIQIIGVGGNPPPPPVDPPPFPICIPSIVLDGQEKLFLDLLNAYRLESGVGILEPSPGLTIAAERHAEDMADNNFLDHIGSDSSTPQDRAVEEGYPSDNVGENIALGLANAIDVLFGWKSSPTHNTNMLDPNWNTIGIARHQGSDWYWSTSFGEVLDCPVALAAPSEDPTSMYAVARPEGENSKPYGTISASSMVLSYSDEFGANNPVKTVSTKPTSLAVPTTEKQVFSAQQVTSLVYPPIAAFTISNLNPEAGEDFTIRNRSVDASGQLTSAVIDLGDSSSAVPLGPGIGVQFNYNTSGDFTIEASATDSEAKTTTAVRSITVEEFIGPPPDFTLTISPSSNLIAPGTTSTFIVSVSALNGFSEFVTFTIDGLPNGLTAQFLPGGIVPSGTTLLQLTANDNPDIGEFSFNVTATGGGIEHTTSSSVEVNFGLIPICTGTFEGTVTDADTGLTIPSAIVRLFPYSSGSKTAVADENGHYVMTGLSLGTNNSPRGHTIRSFATDYWYDQESGTAVCGAVTTVNLANVEFLTGSKSGFVYEGIADPNDPANGPVTPTSIPIEGAQVRFATATGYTASNGRYDLEDITLNYNNAPITSTPNVDANGYWFAKNSNATLGPNEHINANYALVPECFANLSGRVTYADTGLPADFIQLRVRRHTSGFDIVPTDEDGLWDAGIRKLGYNNAPTFYSVQVFSTDEYHGIDLNADILECDEDVFLEFELEAKVINRSTVRGFITDFDTGNPVEGVNVTVGGINIESNFAVSDATGEYIDGPFRIGLDNETTKNGTVRTHHTDYWEETESILMEKDQEHIVDFQILKKRFGSVEGTVRDSATGDPIENASFVSGITAFPTDENGFYQSGPLNLTNGNLPRDYFLWVRALGYWDAKVFGITVEADVTKVVNVDMIEVCDGATITGTVVNAATNEPLEDALVRTTFVNNQSDLTDTNGAFVLEDVPVGTDNSPIQVTVVASKPGFFTQQKTVTVFCNASIVVEFGQPNTAFGTITGTLTNLTTGNPIFGAFIGSEFGGSSTTDSQGQYTLDNAPLGVNESDRTWEVTAIPGGFDPQTKSVTVSADTTSTLDFGFSEAENEPPTADAGGPYSGNEGEIITLDGSGSSDSDGNITSYEWDLDNDGDFDDATGVTTTVSYANAGTHTVGLRVADDDGESDTDTATVNVDNVNQPPSADAGGPYFANESEPISLDGSGSSDPDGSIISYEWDLDNDGQFEDATGATTNVNYASQGTYTVSLRVTDNDGESDTDSATVEVSKINQPPTADAGGPYSADEGETISLDGSGSSDPDGSIISYEWDLDNDGIYDDDAGQTALVSFDYDGTYPIGLKVTDTDGESDTAIASVEVRNVAPVVNAGNDQTINEGETVSLDPASFTDQGIQDSHTAIIDWGDGEITAGVVNQNDRSVSGSHTYTHSQQYIVEVCVTDNDGAEGCDTFTVTVNQPAPPVDEADLEIEKTDSIDPVEIDENISYTITVFNNGPDTASNVVVSDTLSISTSYIAALPEQGSCGEINGTVICDLGDIASNSGVNITLLAEPTNSGTLTNRVSVESDTFDPVDSNNSATESTTITLPGVISDALTPPNISIAQGSGVAIGGTGLFGSIGQLEPGTIEVIVPTNATVEQVLLYWSGVAELTPAPASTTIEVNSISVTGFTVANPASVSVSPSLTTQVATYRADITSLGIVGAGVNTLQIGGTPYVDRTNEGAGIVVIFDDGTTSLIELRDGKDVSTPGLNAPFNAATPQTFTFLDASYDRAANLFLFVDDVQRDRGNRIAVTIGGTTTNFDNLLGINRKFNNGPYWDTVNIPFVIPAGATSLTTSVSGIAPRASSLGWILAGISISEREVYESRIETLSPSRVELKTGTGVASAGTGLFGGIGDLDPSVLTVNVPSGADVKQVLMYWAGVANTKAEFLTTIDVEGITVLGSIVGGPTSVPVSSVLGTEVATYMADVTNLGLVGDDLNTLSITGPAYIDRTNQGVGVIVIFDDGGSEAYLDIREGHDVAFKSASAPFNATVPQVFEFDTFSDERTAEITLFVGDVEPNQRSTIEVVTGGETTQYFDALRGVSGPMWDTLTIPVTIPAGASELSVQIIPGSINSGTPASISWILAALSMQ